MEFSNDNKKYVAEFIERTLGNLKAIENMASEGSNVFEETQFVNSIIGLLIFPKENFFNLIKDEMVSPQLLEKVKKDINNNYLTKQGIPEQNNLKNIIKHIRNSTAHGNTMFPKPIKGKQLTEIKFKDTLTDDKTKAVYTFSLKLNLKTFHELIIQFSENMIKKLKGEKENAKS